MVGMGLEFHTVSGFCPASMPPWANAGWVKNPKGDIAQTRTVTPTDNQMTTRRQPMERPPVECLPIEE